MLKRDHLEEPSTPGADNKRPRESLGSSQDLRTPLKNATNSASFDFISPRRPAEEDEERRKNRTELIKKQQESREALRSPAANASPRAESPSSIVGNMKRSATGSGSGLINDYTSNSGSSPNSLTAHGTRSILTASKSKLSLSSTKLNASQPPLALTVEQMTKSFDEWMKMAADNKINSKNSWNFALIDYFSELTFLRDGDSINFQKASCTLDGCVKIYASRVDSVVAETTKLLNGLSDKSSKFKFEDEDDEEEADGDGNTSTSTTNNNNNNSTGSSKQKSKLKKTSLRTIETVEKNPENLILKNFDLEFSIDPLFKKTSAEFDESGTKGALLKNLECSPIDNLIIFDSSEQISIDFCDSIKNSSAIEEDENIEISYLSSIFGSSIIDLSSKSLCPTFDGYNFNNSMADIKGTLEKLSRISGNIPERIKESENENENENEEQEDDLIVVIENDDREVDDLHFDDYMENDDGGFDGQNENFETAESVEKTVKWSNAEVTNETGLSYFDGAFKQTWAGPEHWKIRKSQRTLNNNTNNSNTNNTDSFNNIGNNSSSSNNNSSTSAKSRKNSKVEKIAIDFINSVIDFRQIFSKPTTSGQISLTKAAIMERNEHDHLLPEDLHFSSASLLKLFIKPNWKMATTSKSHQSSRVTRSSTKSSSEPSGNFVERDFWVSQDDHRNGLYRAPEHVHEEYDEYANDGVNDTIFDGYTDNDDNFFSNYGEEVSKQEPRPAFEPPINADEDSIEFNEPPVQVDFNSSLVAVPKFIYATQLNYARVAKRVDVAKLKSTLWNEFAHQSKPTSTATTTKQQQQPQQPHKQEKSSKTFSSLIKNLSNSYPSETLADLSVPYCFICLLHLANENNLNIQSTDNMDLIISN